MKPWISAYQLKDLNGGQALVLGIHQGRLTGDMPMYIKMDISLDPVVEVQQLALSFAALETSLPDHKSWICL